MGEISLHQSLSPELVLALILLKQQNKSASHGEVVQLSSSVPTSNLLVPAILFLELFLVYLCQALAGGIGFSMSDFWYLIPETFIVTSSGLYFVGILTTLRIGELKILLIQMDLRVEGLWDVEEGLYCFNISTCWPFFFDLFDFCFFLWVLASLVADVNFALTWALTFWYCFHCSVEVGSLKIRASILFSQ